VAIELLANINSLSDAVPATTMGADGVGLFRTEYLFLSHPSVPDEDEQTEAYRAVIEASPGKIFTIRTLDLGGDKAWSYLGDPREANPFMGWRSIRLSFEHPKFFLTQLRAILRAAAGQEKSIRILFPMITTVEEMRRVRALVGRARRHLDRARQPCGEVTLGPMVEVPAAAVMIDVLLHEADFVSIGSNDLVQYLTAADRDNPKVSHLCEPLSPAVLRLLKQLIASCRHSAKPFTLCGEMAGTPRGLVLLLGMGFRSFSMSPAFVPMAKELIRHIRLDQADRIVSQAIQRKTTRQVKRWMDQQLAEICPELTWLKSG
jgi:phosphoenolpyruvate-protein kinase (PTS system EI component)